MPNTQEGQEVHDPEIQKLVEESIQEEKELAKNLPAPKEGEAPKEEQKEEKKPESPPIPKSERPVEHIPAWKLKETEKKVSEISSQLELTAKENADLKAEVERLRTTPPSALDDEFQKFATKYEGTNPEAIQELFQLFSKRFAPPPEFQKIVEEQKKRDEQNRLKQEADVAFESDFTALAKKYPDSSDTKEKLRQLAFSETYASYSLEHIFQLEKDNLIESNKKGMEGSKGKKEGHVRNGEPTEKDLDEMSDKEFMEYTEKLNAKGTLKQI